MNDQSHEDGQKCPNQNKSRTNQSSGKQVSTKTARFHFTVEAESPQINVTVAPIDLKLPPPAWPDWPKSQPNP